MSFETLDGELWGLGTKGQAKSACTSANGLVSKYTSTFEEVTSQRFCFPQVGHLPPAQPCHLQPAPFPSAQHAFPLLHHIHPLTQLNSWRQEQRAAPAELPPHGTRVWNTRHQNNEFLSVSSR